MALGCSHAACCIRGKPHNVRRCVRLRIGVLPLEGIDSKTGTKQRFARFYPTPEPRLGTVPDVVESASGPPARARRAWTPLSRALAVTGDHWTLSIAVALAPGKMRLTHLHKCLPGISTGVLERGLQQMVTVGLLTRTRFKEMPPRVELELTDAGRELLPVAAALARWGMRHVWSAPQEHERADVDVLLRLLPALAGFKATPGRNCAA